MGVTFINLARCHWSLGASYDATKDREMLRIQDQSTLWSKKAFENSPLVFLRRESRFPNPAQ